jgi:hypothetical protein
MKLLVKRIILPLILFSGRRERRKWFERKQIAYYNITLGTLSVVCIAVI